MKIDAHQHFWQLSRGDYGWLTPELGPIYRDFVPTDLAPMLKQAGIEVTILVQAAPTEAETRFMLDIAARTPFVAGVVGWSDFDAADAASRIARLAQDRYLVGLRPMVQDIADDDWLLRPKVQVALTGLQHHDLVFDALVLPRHLPRLLQVAKANPRLQIVIDHAAKPHLKTGVTRAWFYDMAALAHHANVACKLSGLVTEIGQGWSLDMLNPVVSHILECFGPERLIWGSDWPVLNLAADYPRWHGAAEQLLAGLSSAEYNAVMGGNAERIYLARRGRRSKATC